MPEKLPEEFRDVVFLVVDVDENDRSADKYDIEATMTMTHACVLITMMAQRWPGACDNLNDLHTRGMWYLMPYH